jgi:hypothetical protein
MEPMEPMQKAQPLVPVPQPGLQVLEKSPLDQWWMFRGKNQVEPRKMVDLDNNSLAIHPYGSKYLLRKCLGYDLED